MRKLTRDDYENLKSNSFSGRFLFGTLHSNEKSDIFKA